MPTPFERFNRSLTQDNLWIYILMLLKKKDLYPYEIREEVKKKFHFLPGNVTAYIVLKKLGAGGYVKKTGSGSGGGPERTYFTITPKGAEELKKAKDFYRDMGKHLK
jgi:DNA-binding PadR family transcriptional regulator